MEGACSASAGSTTTSEARTENYADRRTGHRTVRAHRQHAERPRRPDLAADRRAVVLRGRRQLVQPVGRARRLRRHRHQPAATSTRTSSRRRTATTRSARSGTSPTDAAARRAVPQREDQRAHGRSGARHDRCSAGKRRVDGLELQLPGTSRRMGRLLRHRLHGRRDRHRGPGEPCRASGRWACPMSPATCGPCTACGVGLEVGGGAFSVAGCLARRRQHRRGAELRRWDATVAYVQKKYEVRLNLNNITDKIYYVGGYNNNPEPRASGGAAQRFDHVALPSSI